MVALHSGTLFHDPTHLETAALRELGAFVPPTVLLRAERVIE
jgi:hypothetical protein